MVNLIKSFQLSEDWTKDKNPEREHSTWAFPSIGIPGKGKLIATEPEGVFSERLGYADINCWPSWKQAGGLGYL